MASQPAVPSLAYAFEVEVDLGSPDDYGDTSRGHRRIIPIRGGRVTGEVSAEILPGGADWQVLRSDGAIEIDSRYSARADDGSLLFIQAVGLRTGSPEVLRALLTGEAVSPTEYYFRTTVSVETSSPRYRHLQDSLYIASCVRDQSLVKYGAYRVT